LNETKSVRYHRLKRRSAVASVAITATLLAALLATGLSSFIADVAHRLAQAPDSRYSPLAIGIYVTMLMFLQESLTFPLVLYQGFLLERRYGLSLERFGGWLKDQAKAFAIGLVLYAAGASLVYGLIRGNDNRSISYGELIAGETIRLELADDVVILIPALHRKIGKLGHGKKQVRLLRGVQRGHDLSRKREALGQDADDLILVGVNDDVPAHHVGV